MTSTPQLEVACALQRGDFHLKADFVSESRATGVYGPSGCGKTTLLLAMAGLLRPADGFIKVAGTSLVNVRSGWCTPAHKRRIALVFQEDRLFPHLTVRDNLCFGYRRMPAAVRRVHPDDLIDLLRLAPLLDRPAHRVSGGEARRVALGRALLMSPRLLLLDEPLTGLEAPLRRDIFAYLVDLPRRLEIPLVYVSHTLSDFLAIAESVFEIRDRRVVEVGAPDELFNRADPGDNDPIESLLRCTVVAAGPESGYARVDIGGQTLTAIARDDIRSGSAARVAIAAHEVLIVLGGLPRSSARNVLEGRVTDIRAAGTRVLVTLDVGQPLRVEVTPAAARELDLRPGVAVHALLKARSVRAFHTG